MAEPTVIFNGVWKKFKLGERRKSQALRDVIPGLVRRSLRRARPDRLAPQEFWALRDVSFQVQPGEALGIIGHNGAGKSTVLKLLTKILRPTRGQCRLHGRVGALIELVAGFHPDLSGRENVFLQGAIMGMKRADIQKRFDDIVGFAGIQEFIDTPVKRYSSGMQARLGFSIAAHLDPEILLIDEVLAVGDLRFQEQCIDRMQRFKSTGVSIVFVSHNLTAVSGLCDRVLLLNHGETVRLGPTEEAIATYAIMRQDKRTFSGDDSAPHVQVELYDAGGQVVQEVHAGTDIEVRALFTLTERERALGSGIRIWRLETGDDVFFTWSTSLGCPPIAVEPGAVTEFRWHLTANLARGHYGIEFILQPTDVGRPLVRLSPAAIFTVLENQSQRGLVYLAARCSAATVGDGVRGPGASSLDAGRRNLTSPSPESIP